MMKNNLFKIIIIVLLLLNLIVGVKIITVIDDLPTLEEIDKRIMHWGQHFGQHFSTK